MGGVAASVTSSGVWRHSVLNLAAHDAIESMRAARAKHDEKAPAAVGAFAAARKGRSVADGADAHPHRDANALLRSLGVTIGMRVTWCRAHTSGILKRAIPSAETSDGEGRVSVLMDDGSTIEIIASGVRPAYGAVAGKGTAVARG